MKELHVRKTDSLVGRLLRAFGLKKASIEGKCVQDEKASVHTHPDSLPFQTDSWRATRSALAELESRRIRTLAQMQRRLLNS